MPVYRATPDDIAQIVTLAFNTYHKVELTVSSPDIRRITKAIEDCVVRETVFVFKDTKDSINVLGVICLAHKSSWWSSDTILEQMFFSVSPEIRDTPKSLKVFSELMDAVLEYAKLMKIPVCQSLVGTRLDVKGRLLERKGYKQIGTAHLLVP